jgi:two-component system, NarL family, sensor histidine kinase UhpB
VPRPAEPASLTGVHPWRRLSLYARVVIVNTLVLALAVLVLVVSPATVSFPVAAEQGVVLVLGVAAMAVSNALLLRVNFRGLVSVVRHMSTLDVLAPPGRLRETGGRDARTLIAGFNGMVDRLEAERRSSTRRAVQALEGERRRLGLELHDEIGQRLTASLLQLQRLAEEAPEELRALVQAIQDQQRATLDEIGALAGQLRPALLDDLGLARALEALVQAMAEPAVVEVSAGLPTTVHGLSAEQELAVYRIAQEALTNAVRHAEATRIRLELEQTPDGLLLEVADDGGGLCDDVEAGPGVRGMRERALLAGGRLTTTARRGGGVLVTLNIPAGPGVS